MDEALYLAALTMAALLPVLSARPNPQIMYASSAGVATSDHLRGVRDRGRAGGDPSLIYLEWCSRAWRLRRWRRLRPCARARRLRARRRRQLESREPLARPAHHPRVRPQRTSRAGEDAARVRPRAVGWWDEPAAKALLIIALDVWAKKAKAEKPEGAPKASPST
jgi:hypothetical protein